MKQVHPHLLFSIPSGIIPLLQETGLSPVRSCGNRPLSNMTKQKGHQPKSNG